MLNQTMKDRLQRLKEIIKAMPDETHGAAIWTFFGWQAEFWPDDKIATSYGLDLKSVIAPDFVNMLNLLIDDSADLTHDTSFQKWSEILKGSYPKYKGLTAKTRMLAVLDSHIRNSLDA